jgi:hypothetical protein
MLTLLHLLSEKCKFTTKVPRPPTEMEKSAQSPGIGIDTSRETPKIGINKLIKEGEQWVEEAALQG